MKKLTAIAITLTAIGVAVKVVKNRKKVNSKVNVMEAVNTFEFLDYGWLQ